MIVNLRGTSGSGKTFLTEKLLRFYERSGKNDGAICDGGRVVGEHRGRKLAVLHCDLIHGYNHCFDLVRRAAEQFEHVLFEGLIVSEEWKRTLQLHLDGLALVVVRLDVDIELCLAGVRARRGESGGKSLGLFPEKEAKGALDEENTRRRVSVIERACDKLSDAGVCVLSGDRDRALGYAEETLGLHGGWETGG